MQASGKLSTSQSEAGLTTPTKRSQLERQLSSERAEARRRRREMGMATPMDAADPMSPEGMQSADPMTRARAAGSTLRI